MSQDELRAIVDRATFLHERRDAHWIPAQGAAAQHLAQARLARWCQLAASGDDLRFQQRLAWDALTTTTVLPLLTDGHWAKDTTLPTWAALLADVCMLPSGRADGLPSTGALVEPFLIVAECRLTRSAGEQLAWLTVPARQQLTAYLKERLIDLATPTLDYLASMPGVLEVRGGTTSCPSVREISQAFPLLARQLATQVCRWVAEIAEFLQRFAMDWPQLAAHDGWPAAPSAGAIAALRPGLSDPHDGGRTVWAVTVAAAGCPNVTAAYKPKDLYLDWAWNELLAWCNAQGMTPRLDHLWTLPRTGYGWMAWAAGEPGVAIHNSERYYQRVGMVLGLLQLLHATDCHAENLITVGDQLLLIDAEMLCYPQIVGEEEADSLDIMRTGLLPRWVENSQGVAEIGGIQDGNLPCVAREAIAAGYQQIQHFLAQQWQQLSADAGPLALFQKGATRFGPRPTAAYLRLTEHLRQPAYLRNGVDFTIAADQLARTYLQHPTHTRCWPLLIEEQAALAQGDVPRFTVQIDQRDLVVGQARVEAVLKWTAPTVPATTVRQQQRQLIIESTARAPYLAPVQRTDKTFLAQALQLGELLVQRAVPLDNGALGWIAPQWQPRSGCWQHALVGDDLYQGRAGIALFLAALYRATGNSDWRDKALAALNGHASTVTGGQRYAYSQCAALLDGPQIDHGLEQFTAQILVDNEATPRVGNAVSWGVLDGMAGHLLGLLAVCRQWADQTEGTSRQRVLHAAISCGDALCTQQRGWLHPIESLGGFAHGAAGIAYALAALYDVCGEHRFLLAAQQGWSFQQQLYDDPPGNWQDRRGPTPVYLHNWCNGAAGIGVAAAASLAVLPELRPVVERAAALLIDAAPRPLSMLDTLCCGRFGQIESLLEMGMVMNQPQWIAQAVEQANVVRTQAAAARYFQLYDELPSQLVNPTFFRGLAGIGYTLLRLAAVTGESDRALPCVLRLAADVAGG